MNIFAFLERFAHHRILCNVRQDAQLKLRIVRGDELIAFLWNERSPDLLSQLGADRNILQVRLGR